MCVHFAPCTEALRDVIPCDALKAAEDKYGLLKTTAPCGSSVPTAAGNWMYLTAPLSHNCCNFPTKQSFIFVSHSRMFRMGGQLPWPLDYDFSISWNPYFCVMSWLNNLFLFKINLLCPGQKDISGWCLRNLWLIVLHAVRGKLKRKPWHALLKEFYWLEHQLIDKLIIKRFIEYCKGQKLMNKFIFLFIL